MGGGVIVLNKCDYVEKMMNLLNNESTYTKKYMGYANSESEKFKREARKIMRGSEKGKRLINLLEEKPRPPRMRGLPKIHKPNIPMRPITSGIGSAPHKVAKQLAMPLSRALGCISGAHLKNSSDLISRLNDVGYSNKKLASFDVKSLFTNVPVEGAIKAMERALDHVRDEDLPLPRADFVKMVSLCVNFGVFTFNGEEYV